MSTATRRKLDTTLGIHKQYAQHTTHHVSMSSLLSSEHVTHSGDELFLFCCRMKSESIFMFCCIYYPAHIPGEEKLLYHEFQHKTLNLDSLE